jgi:hypothetical protein
MYVAMVKITMPPPIFTENKLELYTKDGVIILEC